MYLKIKRLSDNAVIPNYATTGSAGMDLHACLDEPLTITPNARVLVPTGIAVALPSPDFGAFIFPRSGLAAKSGITLSNCVGVVDSDYRGEVKVGLINLSDSDYIVSPEERIAQMVILPVAHLLPLIVSELDETERGAGGFGSTGK